MENFGFNNNLSSEFEVISAGSERNMRPQIAEIATQLEASEDGFARALEEIGSHDEEIRESAMEYLARQQEYLMNAADTFVRIGFNTPEERDTEGAVRARLGTLLETLSSLE